MILQLNLKSLKACEMKKTIKKEYSDIFEFSFSMLKENIKHCYSAVSMLLCR